MSATPDQAQSKAAVYLIKQQVAGACEGRPGKMAPAGAIERDLDGDGAPDLVLSHEEIECSGTSSRSTFCGMQVCSVIFYLRRGPLLRKVHEMLGGGIIVGGGAIPKVSMLAHGGRRGSVRWNGRTFE